MNGGEKMDCKKLAEGILEKVGGKENIESVVHCMTRLRFVLKDENLADDDQVKKIEGVIGLMKKNGQYQIIIGNEVASVYKEICTLGHFKENMSGGSIKKKKQNIISEILDIISSVMSPVIPAIIGAAMIKVLLTVLPMLGLLNNTSQTYELLSVIGDGAFFFMPVLIGMSAAKRFDANPYYAVSIALILLHPNFIALLNGANEAGETIKFFNLIPVTYANYAYSVIPIILSVAILPYIERLVDKITPSITKNFLKPMLVMLFIAPIVMVVIGPLGAILGDGLSALVYFIQDKLGFIAVGLIAAIFPFIVMTGMHHAFTPIKLGVLATTGFEGFICIAEFCSNMAQGAAALAVAMKSKNSATKQNAGSSAFSALVAGITEPALYGTNLRLKRPMIGACLGGLIGGLTGGFFQVKCYGVATPAIVTLPQYLEEGNPQSLIYILITLGVTIVSTFVITYIVGFEEQVEGNNEEVANEESILPLNTGVNIMSPLEGHMIDLSQVNDVTFSSGVMGDGIAIIPTKGRVIAPFDGKIDVFFKTHHAIGLRSEMGVELLIHVGLDTVNLEGKYFTPYKKQGDSIKSGDVILEFDLEKIKEAGYELTTPIIVTNTQQFMDIIAKEKEVVTFNDQVLAII